MVTADQIDALLPQTQCTRCGYAGCAPYARAIVAQEAEINQCPPGGGATIERLAALTNRAVLPLNPVNGVETAATVAVIDESRCIGCAKCLPPCPVDAIVGAGRYMHTVLHDVCTGCELCIAPCPVDCIRLELRATAVGAHSAEPSAVENRDRYAAHNSRIARRATERAALLAAKKHEARAP
jgi:electron transport complex protein RnfB